MIFDVRLIDPRKDFIKFKLDSNAYKLESEFVEVTLTIF